MAVTEGAHNSPNPGDDIFPITPHDTNDLAVTTRALVIAVGGDVALITKSGQSRTVTVPAGVLPVRATRVLATGTTATGISGIV